MTFLQALTGSVIAPSMRPGLHLWAIIQLAPRTMICAGLCPQYQLARQSLALVVTDPFINPDTGHPVIGLGYPILVQDNFVGVASAHITFRGLSELLSKHKASPNSITVIADEHGRLLAPPGLDKGGPEPRWPPAGD